MKKIKFLFGVVLAGIALAGCVNEAGDKAVRGTSISLTAGVEASDATKTDISDPMNPIWSEGDAIGLHFLTADLNIAAENQKLNGTFSPDFVTATFAGEVELANGDYTMAGYYPYSETGEVIVPAVQYPSATSFDAAADIMIMKPVEITHTGEAISMSDLQFKRTMATLKVVLNSEALGGEALKSVSVTTNDPSVKFAGQASIDFGTGEFIEFINGGSTIVTAEPTADVFANGDDFILLNVAPMTLVAGTELTISGTTESYTFSRTVTVPNAGMTFKAGTMFRLGMAITEVEEYDPLGYDETLNNEWVLDDNSTKIEYASFEIYREPARDGYAYYFFDAEPEGLNYSRAILFYIPAAKVGQEIDLSVESDDPDYWELVYDADSYYYGNGRPEGFPKEVIGGKMIVTREGTNIVYKLVAEMSDGKILKAKYVGEAVDMDYIEPGEDIMPGENQWAYNGVISDVGDVIYYNMSEYEGIGILNLYDESRQNSVDLYLPLEMFDGRDINLKEINYPWMVEYYGENDFYIVTQSSTNESYGKMTDGVVNITLEGDGNVTVVTNIVYNDAVHLRVNYSGYCEDIPEPAEPPKPTVPITSIDQLVGDWNVEQKMMRYSNGQFFAVSHNHTLTISKTSNTAIAIKNFSGIRTIYNEPQLADDIKATINSNLEMVIPTNVELIPSWESAGTSHYIPYFGGTYGEGWGVPFAPQKFGETEDGEIVMIMETNYQAFIQTGNVNTDGTYFYTYSVVWTKPANGVVNNIAPFKPAVKSKFDMRSNPAPVNMAKIVKPVKTDNGVFSFKSAK